MLSAFGTAPASLELLHVLTTSFSPLKGAQQEMFAAGTGNENLEDLKLWGERQSASALELGVFSGAKRFVRSPLVQQVVSGIYEGKITFLSHGGAQYVLHSLFVGSQVIQHCIAVPSLVMTGKPVQL